ncbi:MAG: TraR/DksA C4-type zinc finger protein [Desulfobacterales bacterium]
MNNGFDLKYYKKRLEKRLDTLIETQKAGKAANEPIELDQARMGRLSRMDAMQQQAMSRAASHLVDAEIRRIKMALKRIQTDDYGYCINCEEEIAEGRLQVDPSILTCISCARASEKKST